MYSLVGEISREVVSFVGFVNLKPSLVACDQLKTQRQGGCIVIIINIAWAKWTTCWVISDNNCELNFILLYQYGLPKKKQKKKCSKVLGSVSAFSLLSS